jgi:predicted ATP-grasp superfamily ATP-dependent carboligase
MINSFLGALMFFFLPCGLIAQTKVIKPTIEILGKNIKQIDTTLVIVPNSPCDVITLYIDNKRYFQKIGLGSDSIRNATALHCKLKPSSKLEIACGNIRTKSVRVKNLYKYIYISMDLNSCSLIFSDEPLMWDN